MKLNIGLLWKEKHRNTTNNNNNNNNREKPRGQERTRLLLPSWHALDVTISSSAGVPDTPVQCINGLTR